MEYRSGFSFLGLPLVHIAMGSLVDGQYRRGVATAWFAIGDIAIGVFFACGGVAIGGISIGGFALGVLALGGLAIGFLSFGGLAVGMLAVGGAAFAWYLAIGGLALAYEYAIGGFAWAQNVIAPLPPGSLPPAPIPHPSFRWSDALLLGGLMLVLAFLAWTIQARRQE